MDPTMHAASEGSRCARCGANFLCAMAQGESPCWCAGLPILRRLPEGVEGCLCPACLRELIGHQEVAGGC